MKEQVVKSCLLVDDNPDDQESMVLAINRLCDRTLCYTASDGAEALKVLLHEGLRPSFIVTDIQMPQLNGFGLISELKKHPELSQIPVVAMSSNCCEEWLRRLESLGVAEFHPKKNFLRVAGIVKKYLSM